MMLDEEQRVDDLAEQDALTQPPPAPRLVLRLHRLVSGIADPRPEVAIEVADTRLELVAGDRLERSRPRIRGEISQHLASQLFGVVLDEPDQPCGEHRADLRSTRGAFHIFNAGIAR